MAIDKQSYIRHIKLLIKNSHHASLRGLKVVRGCAAILTEVLVELVSSSFAVVDDFGDDSSDILVIHLRVALEA